MAATVLLSGLSLLSLWGPWLPEQLERLRAVWGLELVLPPLLLLVALLLSRRARHWLRRLNTWFGKFLHPARTAILLAMVVACLLNIWLLRYLHHQAPNAVELIALGREAIAWGPDKVDETLSHSTGAAFARVPLYRTYLFAIASRKGTKRSYPDEESILQAGTRPGQPAFDRAISHLGLANLYYTSTLADGMFTELERAEAFASWLHPDEVEQGLSFEIINVYLGYAASTKDADYQARALTAAERLLARLVAEESIPVDLRARILDRRAISSLLRGNMDASIRDWQLALQDLKSAPNKTSAILTTMGDISNNLAVAYMRLGSYALALPALQDAISFGKGDVHRSRLNQLICHIKMKNWAQAVDVANTLQQPHDAVEYALLGAAFRNEASVSYYGRALSIPELKRENLTDEIYRQLAKSAEESFWGVTFEPNDFRL